eukprot:scaffold79656_cov60-Phaeocystis_antarctica.AAC.5
MEIEKISAWQLFRGASTKPQPSAHDSKFNAAIRSTIQKQNRSPQKTNSRRNFLSSPSSASNRRTTNL